MKSAEQMELKVYGVLESEIDASVETYLEMYGRGDRKYDVCSLIFSMLSDVQERDDMVLHANTPDMEVFIEENRLSVNRIKHIISKELMKIK